MKYTPYLLVRIIYFFTIVYGNELTTTISKGIIDNENVDSDVTIATTIINDTLNDPIIGLFKNALKQEESLSSNNNNDDIDITTINNNNNNNVLSSTTINHDTSTSSSSSSYIQVVPKKKLSSSSSSMIIETSTNPTTNTIENGMSFLPRKRLSTLPPISTIITPAALNNSRLLKGWVTDEIADALWAFAPQPKHNPKCTLHSQLYRNSINNFTLWAMQSK